MSESDEEFSIRRPPPPRPYRAGTATLFVSTTALAQTVEALRRTGRIEACCFWYGRDLPDGSGRVEAVIVPRQRGTWGNYDVPPAAIAQVSAATRPKGWVALAQVHSHPGDGIEHSRYDDQRALSRGILSIVFPRYGHWTDPWPQAVGVHEFQDDYWHLLTTADASRRIVAEKGAAIFLDLR